MRRLHFAALGIIGRTLNATSAEAERLTTGVPGEETAVGALPVNHALRVTTAGAGAPDEHPWKLGSVTFI